MRNKVALVVPYFGNFPSYFDYFLETCLHNPDFQFLIFSDNHLPRGREFKNVTYIPFTLAQFNELASKQLHIPVNLKTGYKLCDIKPMYGKIFETYLYQFDFWGYCDIDIIFGDLRKIITDELLDSYDIISTNFRFMAGPFSLYRNENPINTSFMASKDYKRILQEDKVFLFDEASNVISKLWEGYSIFDFPSEVESITHVFKKENNPFKVLFAPLISERLLNRKRLVWEKGVLMDLNGVEFHIFHFLVYKSKVTFSTPPLVIGEKFYFTEHGIFQPNLRSFSIDWFNSILTNTLSKIKRKLKF
ncbi:DUF6625 family protein [Rufibacter tibetensis]|uniref:DUF6625 family protein n=1 Tax=Rufibacter tibetensis TaxID=512763 RepID=UPI0007853FAF|nr:DUF6625 family protein [Rufibacter tibetensis]